VKPRAERPKFSELRATVKIGSEKFDLAGRTAAVRATRLYEKRVNEPVFEKLVAHFGEGEAQLELREGLPSVWLRSD